MVYAAQITVRRRPPIFINLGDFAGLTGSTVWIQPCDIPNLYRISIVDGNIVFGRADSPVNLDVPTLADTYSEMEALLVDAALFLRCERLPSKRIRVHIVEETPLAYAVAILQACIRMQRIDRLAASCARYLRHEDVILAHLLIRCAIYTMARNERHDHVGICIFFKGEDPQVLCEAVQEFV